MTSTVNGDIKFRVLPCALGLALVAWSEKGICAVLLGDSAAVLELELRARFSGEPLAIDEDEEDGVAGEVVAYLNEEGRALDAALDLRGTEFQRAVWEALRMIPAGMTVTYTELAARVGRPGSVRAVAQACGANGLAVVVPCHRALGSDGSLSGYRWGLERKAQLLAREGAVIG